MSSGSVFKWHIKIFGVCALWPPGSGSKSYFLYTLVYSLYVYIVVPLSLLSCVLFLDSVDAIVDHLILSSSTIMISIKSFALLIKHKAFIQILDMMKGLDETVTIQERQQILLPIARRSIFLLSYFGATYGFCFIFLTYSVVVSEPEHRIWPSTYFYPIEILHRPVIYISGLVFQGVASLLHVSVVIALDTYGASLIDSVAGHISILCQRFQAFGDKKPDSVKINGQKRSKSQQKLELIDLCENYILILRCARLLEEILSFAMFSQFCVSALILCTCAYQLSSVSPVDNFPKFMFAVPYSINMFTEIFVPSFFGSKLIESSESLPYAIFKSNWMDQSESIKRSTRILVEKTLRPVSISAAHIFELNLPFLLKILKAAYSIFALLKNV